MSHQICQTLRSPSDPAELERRLPLCRRHLLSSYNPRLSTTEGAEVQRLLRVLRSEAQQCVSRCSQPFASARQRLQGHVLPEGACLYQLGRGARFLSAKIYNNNGEISVRHKYYTQGAQSAPKCAGSLFDFLRDITTFLGRNDEEAVTSRLINRENRDIKDLDPIISRSGLKDLAFVPSARPLSIDDWLIYGKLIENNKRFIIFLNSGAAPARYPYILPQPDYFFETAKDELRKCDAVSSDANTQGKMYMMSHNAETSHSGGYCRKPLDPAYFTRFNRAVAPLPTVPDVTLPDVEITQHADTCKGKFNKYPNVFWLDLINVPNLLSVPPGNGVFAAQEKLNRLPDGILGEVLSGRLGMIVLSVGRHRLELDFMVLCAFGLPHVFRRLVARHT
jgi:hypothetical protein